MRYTFGGQAVDFLIEPPSVNARVLKSLANQSGGTAWSAQVGGSQYTDLQPIGTDPAPITTDGEGRPRPFYGPDGVRDLWVSFGGSRFLLRGREIGSDADVAALWNNPGSAFRTAADADLSSTFARKFQTNAADFANLQAAVDGTATGGRLYIPPTQTWTITAAVNVARAMTIYGDQSVVSQTTTGPAAFNITASDVHLSGLVLVGAQSAVVNLGTECGVLITGASTSSRCANVTVQSCTIHRFGYAGISALFADKFKFDGNEAYDLGYGGIMLSSCSNGRVTRNDVLDIVQGAGVTNSYGIALTHRGDVPIATNPRTENVLVEGNYVTNVPLWEGIDTHGGKSITIKSNVVTNCRTAIALVPGKDNNVTSLAPLDITVSGNILDSGRSDGVTTLGIGLIGCSSGVGTPIESATGTITGNVLKRFGTDSSSGAGINLQDTIGAVVSGNVIIEPVVSGIRLDYNNKSATIVGNTVIDSWTNDGGGASYAVYVASQYNTATIGGNTATTRSKVAAKVNNRGIHVSTGTNNTINVLQNDFDSCPFPLIDAGNATASRSHAKKFGAYGATPVVKPAAPGTATGTDAAVINALVAALRSQGLVT